MYEYNKQAAIKAMVEKNKDKSSIELDLHGLLSEEAIKLIEAKIKIIKEKETNKILIAVVGKGLHSKTQPKLKTAVIEFAKCNKIQYFENVPNEGCILLDLNENKFEQ